MEGAGRVRIRGGLGRGRGGEGARGRGRQGQGARCLGQEDIACDVDEILWPYPERSHDVSQ